jgi:iron transport multicopper oxidase
VGRSRSSSYLIAHLLEGVFVQPIGSTSEPGYLQSSLYHIITETKPGRAVLQYENASDTEEPIQKNPPTLPAFDETKLFNADFNNPGLGDEEPLPENIHNIDVRTVSGSNFFTVNNKTFFPPTVPTLLQILSGAKDPADFIPSPNLIVLPRNSLIEVRLTGVLTHPMHLHGHSFDVVKPSASTLRNTKNPARRDVVVMRVDSTTIFRFRTDNPGPWLLHCQYVRVRRRLPILRRNSIDWHFEAGLALIFGGAPADNAEGPNRQEIPPAWNDLCPRYEAHSPGISIF